MMIKKYSTEIGLISLIFALLVWFGIKPSSFKLVIFEQIPTWLIRIALILLIFWAVYISVKIKKLLKTEDFDKLIDSISTPHDLPEVKPPKEKEVEFTKDQLFILALIAESDEVSFNSLSESYREQFPEANQVEIKYIANLLRENGLIRRSGNIRGNLLYMATDKGIERVRKESEIIKEYRKAIEENKEMSKMAKKF